MICLGLISKTTNFNLQAVKLSSQANELASDLGSKVNTRVLKPAQQKLTDKKVVEDITLSMSSWASKVCFFQNLLFFSKLYILNNLTYLLYFTN